MMFMLVNMKLINSKGLVATAFLLLANRFNFYWDKITPYPQCVLTLAILDCQVIMSQNTSSQPNVGSGIDAKMTQKWEFIEACKVNWEMCINL